MLIVLPQIWNKVVVSQKQRCVVHHENGDDWIVGQLMMYIDES